MNQYQWCRWNTGSSVCGLLLALLLLPITVLRAAPISPPMHALYDPLNAVVVARLLAVESDGRLLFERIEVLHGDAVPDRIEVSAPTWIDPAPEPDRRYLLGYTPYRRDSSRVRTIIVDPDGPRLLVSPGLEPALFPDEPAYRALLDYGRGGRIAHLPDAVEMILAALVDRRAPMRALAAAQLAFDPALSARLGPAELDVARKTLADPATPWVTRTWLYDWMTREPERFASGWLRRQSRHLLQEAPLLDHGQPGHGGQLVGTIFAQAERRGWRFPRTALTRWLDSDSTALAELALLQLRRQSPRQERRAIAQALARKELHPEMRRFLEGHQRRVDARPGTS